MSENGIKIYLGVDWGSSKIGLAQADSEMKIAIALKTIKNDSDSFNKITKIIEEEGVDEIIIGIPSYINKEEVIYGGEEFGEKIKIRTGLPIFYQNEMFTTKMAQANLIQKGDKNIGKSDDQEAARIILQEWLDSKITS